jgi:hypothetical protein
MKETIHNKGKKGSVKENEDNTHDLLQSSEFIQAAKKHSGAFTKIRKLTLIILFKMLINLVKSSSQTAIDHYIDRVQNTQMSFSHHAFKDCKVIIY